MMHGAKLGNIAMVLKMTRVYARAVRSLKCRQGNLWFSEAKHLSMMDLVNLCAIVEEFPLASLCQSSYPYHFVIAFETL